MLTNRFIKYALLLFAAGGCSRDKFSELNTNPDVLLSVPPQYEYTNGALALHNRDFEYYYDYNRAINYWAQEFVTLTGNSVNVYQGSGNLNQRTSNFYSNVGPNLVDAIHLIDIMPPAQKAQYVYMRAIAGIPMAYYAWYVSDVQGSIAYTQAFKARYTGLMTPTYDTQEALYDTLDNQLKNIVTILKTTQPVTQVDLGVNDIHFGTADAVTKWIKTANSLRLKMAFRLMKRNPTKLKQIATEVLADNIGVINALSEDWKFVAAITFTGSNYNPESNSSVSGAKNTVDFMFKTKDPRIRVFYQQSGINTQDKFDSAKAQGALPASLTWTGQAYQGQFVDPDASTDPAKNYYYSQRKFSYKGVPQSVDYPSHIQVRLFYGQYSSGKGTTTYPLITYADICFMRAELAIRGITTENAQDWYYKGIDASLATYNTMGATSLLDNYVPITSGEITDYKLQPGIVYNPANALEQIIVQQYLNYYKNPTEAWALIKRTGLPAKTGVILQLEEVHNGGTLQAMPRRFAVNYPSITDMNFSNSQNAIDDQVKDPAFGIPTDITGRVWWDKP
jgi:hypothetical protein